MGEISKCSRRAEKPVSGSGNSGKEDRKWLEEVIQKTIKESVRELGICGTTEQLKTKPSSEEIPAQMMDFYLKWKICKGGEAYDCTIHTLLDLLGVRTEMYRYLWWVL